MAAAVSAHVHGNAFRTRPVQAWSGRHLAAVPAVVSRRRPPAPGTPRSSWPEHREGHSHGGAGRCARRLVVTGHGGPHLTSGSVRRLRYWLALAAAPIQVGALLEFVLQGAVSVPHRRLGRLDSHVVLEDRCIAASTRSIADVEVRALGPAARRLQEEFDHPTETAAAAPWSVGQRRSRRLNGIRRPHRREGGLHRRSNLCSRR